MSARSRNLWRGYRWRESAWTRTRAIMALGMVLGLGSVGTMAKWSQTVTAETGLFSTSTIDLTINDQPKSASLTAATNLARGGTAAGIIKLRNKGKLNLKYTMDLGVAALTSEVGGAGQQRGNAESLLQKMTLTIREDGSHIGNTCTGGTVVVSQVPPSSTTGALGGKQINGDSTHTYCVQVSVAPDAPVESRMAQVGYTFTFNANIA